MESAPQAPLAAEEKPATQPSQPAETQKQPKQKTASNNPVIAIAIAILLALILSGLSLVSFLHSDAHKTVQLIQKNPTDTTSDSALDTTSALKSSDIDSIQSAITKDLAGANDAADFSPNELTDAALGL